MTNNSNIKTPAEWDNKDLMQEWDWLFDGGEYTECKNDVLGFIENVPCYMRYVGHILSIKVLYKNCDEKVLHAVEAQAAMLERENESVEFVVTSGTWNGTFVVTIETYWKE